MFVAWVLLAQPDLACFGRLQVLLQCGAKVYLACRSKARAQNAIAELEREAANGGEVEFLELDLADFASGRRCAAEFLG